MLIKFNRIIKSSKKFILAKPNILKEVIKREQLLTNKLTNRPTTATTTPTISKSTKPT